MMIRTGNIPPPPTPTPYSHSYDKFTKCLEKYFNYLNIFPFDKRSGGTVVKRWCYDWMAVAGEGSSLPSAIIFFH